MSKPGLGSLEHLLAPEVPAHFFERHWNQKALYQPGQADKFSGLFSEAAFRRALPHCADLKVGFTGEDGWPSHFTIGPEKVDAMLAGGKTVCAGVIDSRDRALTSFLAEFRKHFAVAGRFYFNAYLSPDGGGFGLHLDDHPVCILQIEGQKRWWYSQEPALPAVLSNIAFPKQLDTLKLPWVTVTRPREQDLTEVVLSPGDILYLPKGCWHRAQAIDGSLALTLAMESISPFRLVQYALGPRLDTIDFRSALPGYWSQSLNDGIPAELDAAFVAALDEMRKVLDSMTTATLYRAWGQLQARSAEAQVSKKVEM
jgi:hypothetical protein